MMKVTDKHVYGGVLQSFHPLDDMNVMGQRRPVSETLMAQPLPYSKKSVGRCGGASGSAKPEG